MTDQREHLRGIHQVREEFSLVDQVGKPPRVRLLLELGSGGFPLRGEQLLHALTQGCQLMAVEVVWQNDEARLVELLLLIR